MPYRVFGVMDPKKKNTSGMKDEFIHTETQQEDNKRK